MPIAISCHNLTKTYEGKPPVEAVRGIDLLVSEGECFGLLGPNGAGKTTTLEIFEGLLEASSGDVNVLGLTWSRDALAIRERIGISLQETHLSDKLTVAETLGLFRSFYASGLTVEQAIDRVSLGEKRNSRVEKLSGGQKQRLAVACALVGDPELLFLDEPTTGLDPQSRRQLWEVIGQFRKTGRTVVLTTHYMDEAERLCDRVAIVDHGQIIALGSPRELISRLQADHVILLSLESSATPPPVEELARVPSVRSVRHEEGEWLLSVALPHVALPALLDYLKGTSRELATLTTRHATLEDVFVGLTGRHLRDAEEVRP